MKGAEQYHQLALGQRCLLCINVREWVHTYVCVRGGGIMQVADCKVRLHKDMLTCTIAAHWMLYMTTYIISDLLL
jgi:hypothetical protein